MIENDDVGRCSSARFVSLSLLLLLLLLLFPLVLLVLSLLLVFLLVLPVLLLLLLTLMSFMASVLFSNSDLRARAAAHWHVRTSTSIEPGVVGVVGVVALRLSFRSRLAVWCFVIEASFATLSHVTVFLIPPTRRLKVANLNGLAIIGGPFRRSGVTVEIGDTIVSSCDSSSCSDLTTEHIGADDGGGVSHIGLETCGPTISNSTASIAENIDGIACSTVDMCCHGQLVYAAVSVNVTFVFFFFFFFFFFLFGELLHVVSESIVGDSS